MLLRNKNGFTLVEMLVSISILVVLSTMLIANFNAGERQTRLNASANVLSSEIRKVQNMVLNGAKFGDKEMPFGGYGIHFENNKYILFADNNSNKVYDLSEGMATTTLKDIQLEFSFNNLLFTPPKAQVCMNNDGCSPCDCNIKNRGVFTATTTHAITGDKIGVKVNQISGRVDVE